MISNYIGKSGDSKSKFSLKKAIHHYGVWSTFQVTTIFFYRSSKCNNYEILLSYVPKIKYFSMYHHYATISTYWEFMVIISLYYLWETLYIYYREDVKWWNSFLQKLKMQKFWIVAIILVQSKMFFYLSSLNSDFCRHVLLKDKDLKYIFTNFQENIMV